VHDIVIPIGTENKLIFFNFYFIYFLQDLKKGIREDPRYTKFSSSEKKCEKEFVAWLKDKTMKARDDYKQLLQVRLQRFSFADPGMFFRIPDPTFFRILDPNFFHPGSASKNLSILTPKDGF
jgi:hypothetical protein